MKTIERLKGSAAFKEFMEAIEEKAKDWKNVLRGSGDINEIFRAQGALNFFEYVKDLPDLTIFQEKQKDEEEIGY